MIVEGINFNDQVCLQMQKDEFVAFHEETFFLDRPLEERRKVLGKTYDLMVKESKGGLRVS